MRYSAPVSIVRVSQSLTSTDFARTTLYSAKSTSYGTRTCRQTHPAKLDSRRIDRRGSRPARPRRIVTAEAEAEAAQESEEEDCCEAARAGRAGLGEGNAEKEDGGIHGRGGGTRTCARPGSCS